MQKIKHLPWIQLAAGSITAFTSCMTAFAGLKITPNISVDDFNRMTGPTVEGPLLWIIFYLLRLVGAVVLIWGIHGYLIAKKDGNADEINQAMVKLIFGGCLLGLPWLLSEIGVIGIK